MNTIVTKATGGTAAPVGVLYIEPDRQVPDASADTDLADTDLVDTDLADTGLNAPFIADLLSACLAHERCGVHLYRAVATRTELPELRERYEDFGDETLEHVRLLAELIAGVGGDPQYVSASARATEKAAGGLVESTFMLAGSVDADTAELAMLEAVMLAEAKDQANWELLSLLIPRLPDGAVRSQFESVVGRVLQQEDEHYSWAREARAEMLFVLATGEVLEAAGADPGEPAGPDLAADSTKAELYEQAKKLEIEGRSQMTKAELADALAEQSGEDR